MEKFSAQIGEIVSHFRILEKLGSGRMRLVYEAEDTPLHRFVVLKVPPGGVELGPFDGTVHELRPKRRSPGLVDPTSVSIGLHRIWVF
jgi:serine/threonine protein kinase